MAQTRTADQAGRATRERILRAGLEIFAECGYAGTSLTAVARRAGLSTPGLLHHFADKSALLAAVLEKHGQKDDEKGEYTVEFASLDVDAALGLMVRTVEDNLANREVIRLAHLCALATDQGAEVAAVWVKARMDRVRADIRVVGDLARARGEIPADPDYDPAALASLVIAAFLGLEHQWLMDESFDMVAGMRVFSHLLTTHFRCPTG